MYLGNWFFNCFYVWGCKNNRSTDSSSSLCYVFFTNNLHFEWKNDWLIYWRSQDFRIFRLRLKAGKRTARYLVSVSLTLLLASPMAGEVIGWFSRLTKRLLQVDICFYFFGITMSKAWILSPPVSFIKTFKNFVLSKKFQTQSPFKKHKNYNSNQSKLIYD